jgi:hypothetical protein
LLSAGADDGRPRHPILEFFVAWAGFFDVRYLHGIDLDRIRQSAHHCSFKRWLERLQILLGQRVMPVQVNAGFDADVVHFYVLSFVDVYVGAPVIQPKKSPTYIVCARVRERERTTLNLRINIQYC